MFKDCFGKILQEGDDIIVSVHDILHEGRILTKTNDFIIISFKYWDNGKQEEGTLCYHPDGDIGLNIINENVMNIYKI